MVNVGIPSMRVRVGWGNASMMLSMESDGIGRGIYELRCLNSGGFERNCRGLMESFGYQRERLIAQGLAKCSTCGSLHWIS